MMDLACSEAIRQLAREYYEGRYTLAEYRQKRRAIFQSLEMDNDDVQRVYDDPTQEQTTMKREL